MCKDLEIDFTYILNVFGKKKVIELVKDGKNILVNE